MTFSIFLNVNHVEVLIRGGVGFRLAESDEKSESIFELSILELVIIDMLIAFFNFFEF